MGRIKGSKNLTAFQRERIYWALLNTALSQADIGYMVGCSKSAVGNLSRVLNASLEYEAA